MSLASLIRRARRLSFDDHVLLLESVIVAIGLEAALWVMPFARVRRWAERSADRPANPTQERRERLARFAAAAYRVLPLPRTCLRESLVLCALLRRRGIPRRLCLGVAKTGGAFRAHAWVETDDRPVELLAPYLELI